MARHLAKFQLYLTGIHKVVWPLVYFTSYSGELGQKQVRGVWEGDGRKKRKKKEIVYYSRNGKKKES